MVCIGSTSPAVKAVEVMYVPTDAKLRNNEQSQMIRIVNKESIDSINTVLKMHYDLSLNLSRAMLLMVFPTINYKGLTNKVIM